MSAWARGTMRLWENDCLNHVQHNVFSFYATLQWMPLLLGGRSEHDRVLSVFWFSVKMYTQWCDGSWFISKPETGLTFNFTRGEENEGAKSMAREKGEKKGGRRGGRGAGGGGVKLLIVSSLWLPFILNTRVDAYLHKYTITFIKCHIIAFSFWSWLSECQFLWIKTQYVST